MRRSRREIRTKATCGRWAALPAMAFLFSLGPEASTAEPVPLWANGKPLARLVLPAGDGLDTRLAESTLNGYLQRGFGVKLLVEQTVDKSAVNIVAGTPENNPALAALVRDGLKLAPPDAGGEGFHILTHEAGGTRHVVVHGATPRSLKHGCQELAFYRLTATVSGGAIDWPLDITMTPQMRYRGCYILPCWSAYDTAANWERVIRFNSELTLNRNWFWIDGFPVAGHTGEYADTELASDQAVQRLFDVAAAEDTKILIGGGWFNWHHAKAVGNNLDKGIQYYLDFIRAFRNFHGFYIEPTGEGGETQAWRDQLDALLRLVARVQEQRPEFEFALATGKFNNPEYHRRLATLDPARVYWWWCWGDPTRDDTRRLFPSVLRWHVITRISDFQGTTAPPEIWEKDLSGIATSYDPGQGFGNPWDGWGKMGVREPRNVDPYGIPYFAHQYYFRERCWNLKLSEWDFTLRLGRRLFDADAPRNCGNFYWWLSKLALAASCNQHPTAEQLQGPREFLQSTGGRRWTPRMQDTLDRMNEAMGHLGRLSESRK